MSNKVFRKAYFHISNSGATIRVEEDKETKFPILVIDWNTFGNLNTTFKMLTRKEYLHDLGIMLIKAASMADNEPQKDGGAIAKLYNIKDGEQNILSRPMHEYGFTND